MTLTFVPRHKGDVSDPRGGVRQIIRKGGLLETQAVTAVDVRVHHCLTGRAAVIEADVERRDA